jgi:hypothetical protein
MPNLYKILLTSQSDAEQIVAKELPVSSQSDVEKRFVEAFLASWTGINWLEGKSGREFLWKHGVEFIETEHGGEWFRDHGAAWLDSEDGRKFLGRDRGRYGIKLIKTKPGAKWFRDHGAAWLDSEDGREFLGRDGYSWCSIKLIEETEPGAKWFRDHGATWLDSEDGRKFLQLNREELIKIVPDVKRSNWSLKGFNDLGRKFRNKVSSLKDAAKKRT